MRISRSPKFLRPLLVAVVLSLFAAACGGSDASDASVGADTSVKPIIFVPAGDPPTELVVEDIVVGDGDEAVSGASVNVDYVGVSWSTGTEFDASWGRGEFGFSLGVGQVIPGWDEGVQGMLVGGRRQITIPPEMAYGPNGFGEVIAPNETLIFVVDLRGIN